MCPSVSVLHCKVKIAFPIKNAQKAMPRFYSRSLCWAYQMSEHDGKRALFR